MSESVRIFPPFPFEMAFFPRTMSLRFAVGYSHTDQDFFNELFVLLNRSLIKNDKEDPSIS